MRFDTGLGLVFIHLKLSNEIDWHWAFVVAPLFVRFVWVLWEKLIDGR